MSLLVKLFPKRDYKNTVCTRLSVTHCEQTAQELFGDFVKGYSTISQPLHQLLTDYNKTRRVVWNPESTAAFYEMKLESVNALLCTL